MDLWANLIDHSLIVAGSETAATLLCGCIYYLCTNPQARTRLTGEIRAAFPKEDDMTFRNMASLPYLSAVIEESLRKYPPFVTSLARIVPQGGAFVDGHLVPEGVRFPAVFSSATKNLFLTNHGIDRRLMPPLRLLPRDLQLRIPSPLPAREMAGHRSPV